MERFIVSYNPVTGEYFLVKTQAGEACGDDLHYLGQRFPHCDHHLIENRNVFEADILIKANALMGRINQGMARTTLADVEDLKAKTGMFDQD